MLTNKSTSLQPLLYLIFLLGVISCSSEKASQQEVLRHLVFFQFKEDVTEERKNNAIQIFLDLEDQIPEIKKIEGGANISDKALNKGFTHCFILTFDSEAARDIYLPHPEHVRVVEENKPVLNDLLVVDIWGKE